MAIPSSENRRHKRVPLALSIIGKCAVKAFRSHDFQGETRNVSYNGLCIQSQNINGFKVGQKVTFKTRLYDGDFLLKGQGILCWIRDHGNSDGPANMGIRLTRMRHYGSWCERIEEKILHGC
ncbi:MAG: PilZ domain-containing protein [Deltaproteobacteria bacterium]|nr:PilZ domain-containing protein [Deltaproteobacteria bacterium]